MADDYFALKPSGVHNDDALPSESLQDGSSPAPYRSPLDSPEPPAAIAAKPRADDGARKKQLLSPSELVSVLDRDLAPPPDADARFLHGGPPLSSLDAPSVVPLGAVFGRGQDAKPVATARWRAFTDEEERMLQAGWKKLKAEQEASEREKGKRREERSNAKDAVEAGAEDDDAELPHCYPVGLDKLFSVSLTEQILFPAFWQGSAVRVLLATWFYAPPSATSSSVPAHMLKPYPVDPELCASLDRAYASIRPWEESYELELASALKGGVEAQMRLSVELGGVGNESGQDTGANGSKVEVIFTSRNEGRLYSKGFLGSVGKSLWSSGKGLGGGQVVLRGWEAMRTYHERKQGHKKKKSAHQLQENSASTGSALDTSDTDSNASPTASRSRHGSSSTTGGKPAAASASAAGSESGFFALLKSKIYGAPNAVDHEHDDEQEQGESSEERANETSEAMAGPRNKEGEGGTGEVGEVDELVLVVHGIGQRLAANYESFSFVHAVNQMRKVCTSLSTSPTLAPLLRSKRAQVFPLLWRTDLSFEDEFDDTRDEEDEHLRNQYTLEDIEIKGSIPFLRQVVSGLVLDVPFYLSHHKPKMTRAVVREANRIYRLFCARNPHFASHGKVTIIAHSLGSALACDILSAQPTHVKPLKEMTRAESHSETTFAFNTHTLFLVGSPLAFFMHLGKGQLIARRGRERTKGVAKDVALDRAGRYGCMAVDSVYNVYNEADPVAFALNAAVDVKYSQIIKPIAIPSSTTTLLQNLSDTYTRVSKLFDVSSLWSSASASKTASKAQAEVDSGAIEQQKKADDAKKSDGPRVAFDEVKNAAAAATTAAAHAAKSPKRPGAGKRMPSERPMSNKEFEVISRAEKRFNALNPNGCIDFFLPAEGYISQYVDALSAHGSYWTDPRFVTFVLTQMFATREDLERAGREEIGEDHEHEEEAK